MKKRGMIWGILVLSLITACGTNAGQKETVGPVSVEFPDSWVKTKSKTGLAAIYKSPTTHKIGDGVYNDLFFIRVAPAGNATLPMMKAFLSQTLKQSAQKITSQFKKAGVPHLKGVDLAKLDKFSITETKIDGVPALEVKNHSILQHKGTTIEKNCSSVIVLVDKKFYTFVANYDVVQEKELRPMAEKFLKSIKIQQK